MESKLLCQLYELLVQLSECGGAFLMSASQEMPLVLWFMLAQRT